MLEELHIRVLAVNTTLEVTLDFLLFLPTRGRQRSLYQDLRQPGLPTRCSKAAAEQQGASDTPASFATALAAEPDPEK